MKNLFIILLSMLSIAGLSVQAQTKKPAPKSTTTTTKKTTTSAKKAPAKTATTTTKATPAKTTTTSAPEKKEENVVAKTSTSAVKLTKASAGSSSSYKTALGLKFIYGISFTGKFFINDKAALEGILRYNGAGGAGSNIAFSGLYEHHSDIKTVEGLRWYVGGGGHVNYFSYKGGGDDPVISFGVAGIVGLEYKIKGIPLAISADWQPGFMISPSSGFSAENGGLGLKYTF